MLSGATTWRWVFSPTSAQAVPVTGMVVASEVGLVGCPLLQGKKWGNNSGIREKGKGQRCFNICLLVWRFAMSVCDLPNA